MNHAAYSIMPRSFVFRDLAFHLGVFRLTEHNNYQYHVHENYCELVVIGGGHAKHVIDGMEYTIGPGDVFVIREGQIHAYSEVNNVQVNNILFDPASFPFYDLRSCPGYQFLFNVDPQSNSSDRFDKRFRLDVHQLKETMTLVDELEKTLASKMPGARFSAVNLFCRLLQLIFIDYQTANKTTVETQPYLLGKLISWLERHYGREISVDEMCGICHMSRAGMFRNFRKYFNDTPLNYLNHIRIENASQMLVGSEMNIGEIAEKTGFAAPSYFCRRFRAATGFTPQEFRRKFSAHP